MRMVLQCRGSLKVDGVWKISLHLSQECLNECQHHDVPNMLAALQIETWG